MDPNKLKTAYARLQMLDDRLTYRIKPQGGGMTRPSVDQVDEKLRYLAEFTIELKEVLHEVILSFARPKAPAGPNRESPEHTE